MRHKLLRVFRKLILPEAELLVVGSKLYAKKTTRNGEVIDYGLQSQKLITNRGMITLLKTLGGFYADDNDFSVFYAWNTARGHTSGTGTNPESFTDTNLQSPIQTSPVTAATYNYFFDTTSQVYKLRSIATLSYSLPATVSEHAVWSFHPGNATWHFFDRSVLATPISVLSGDTITFTYILEISRA
ncbi:hypothetical protein Hydth_0917 [Hydrogenobacter thermophilus TK-6]|uniref:Uncharacterized protein n=1 Tax=Hydrogenobacter thermophilus (strain DSM 6534 / IAM 12695 / TK-6) TaxID=608538 RepID=D3DHS7_HYDTT|nr:hypothetical protein [Hydrogenobacter thermophilus]ADO45313.1 hypothetical protein Hydth_0917 [Hydrogenobacter thermophilus TK-6]BAI69379.1 hypothetical protein HTH_0920 [Hydrogenobacter thermophilus TK-6]